MIKTIWKLLYKYNNNLYGTGSYDISLTATESAGSGDSEASDGLMFAEPEQNDPKEPIEVDFTIKPHERKSKVWE